MDPKRVKTVGRPLWLAITVAALTLLVVLSASCRNSAPVLEANTCVDDVTGETNNCTANDVELSILYNVKDITCVEGEMVTLKLRAELVAGSAERYDIGMFVAEDGGDALTGSCYHGYLPPPLSEGGTCSESGDDCNWDGDCEEGETCEEGYNPGEPFPGPDGGPFFNAESKDASDTCGDIEQGVHTYYDLNNGDDVTVPCLDTDGNGTLDIGTVVTWHHNEKTTCTGVEGAVPGTKSKCRADRSEVANVLVQPGDIRVSKSADPESVKEPGGDVDFTFVVENTSEAEVRVTINSLVDVPFGDLNGNPDSTCTLPQDLDFEEAYTCTLTAAIEGEPGIYTNTVTAAGIDAEQIPLSDTATARVMVVDILPSIVVTKTASPTSVEETGGEVSFSVVVANDGVEPVELISLEDDLYGDLDGEGTCSLEQTIAAGDTYACAFSATVSGTAGTVVTNTVTARAEDNEENQVESADDAAVRITDVLPAINVTKTADPKTVAEPGGKVQYTVKVANLGKTGTVTLTALTDDIYGDLTSGGNISITKSTCGLVRINEDETYQCSFKAKVAGSAGETVTDVVTAVAEDKNEDAAKAADDATVKIVSEPPDTGAGMAVPTVVGSLALAGMSLLASGAWLGWARRKD